MVMGEATIETQVAVVGAGTGGYAAAFRAADLGLEVTLIDINERPGGVCLFSGCIPSKAILHVTNLIYDARQAGEMGVVFEKPQIDLDKLRSWKGEVVDQLADGLVTLSDRREVRLLQGRAEFESSNSLRVSGKQTTHVEFENVILATGSKAIALPGTEFKQGSRIMSSESALELSDIPERLLVVGAGYVGLELGWVYAILGSQVTLVEMTGEVLPRTDRDLVRPLQRRIERVFEAVHLNTTVSDLKEKDNQVLATLEGDVEQPEQTFDRVLVAIGREPYTKDLGLGEVGVEMDEQGFIQVDEQLRTNNRQIFAVGDVTGGKMLAHKAMSEGKVAAEVIAGEPAAFDFRTIPSVVYTDPQIAWAGLTESDAQEERREVRISRFPWRASGRALTTDSTEGMTKIIFEPDTERILGIGIVGREAGEMIAEGVLAIEMGAVAADLAMTIHPHPTLSETESETAEALAGQATHIQT